MIDSNLSFAPANDSVPDVIVAALKTLGGIGHCQEITEQCGVMGFPHPEDSIRARLQANSSEAFWNKPKPATARDLFYTFDTKKKTGIWGLRGFSVDAPDEYPIYGLTRAYGALLERVDTPLPMNDPHGIVYRGGVVQALQVGFAPGSTYPDRLLTDGHIEHIGEGKARAQSESRGNRGMIEAHRQGLEIPVFQSIGRRGNKRYVPLGWYRVVEHTRRMVRLPENDFDTDAFIFTLEPSSRETPEPQPAFEFPPAQDTTVEDFPVESHRTDHVIVSARSQIEAYRRELPLVKRFEAFASSQGKTVVEKRITIKAEVRAFRADLFIVEPHLLIEAKGSSDRTSFRMAIGQIADYRRNLNNPRCAILLPEKPAEDLLDLASVEQIGVIWPAGDSFTSTIELW